MHIDELENYNLADAVRYHDELNPGLWGKDEHLRPEVREALLRIADDFREFLGVDDLEVKDITISGSNAAFNYTPTSDIDLHLVVNIPELDDEVYRELFNAKKYQYNDQHDIRVRGSDVELYVQPAEDNHISQGIYSVVQQKWLNVPRRLRAEVDDDSVRHKAEDLEARIQQAMESGDPETMNRLWQKIKDMRKAGLEQKGEFSTENLVFKLLRVNGLIEKLQTARQAARDQELSLNERKRKKSRSKYAYGGYWYPGFGYTDGSSDSGGDGGGESAKEDVGSSWDGVSPTTRMFTSEDEHSNNKKIISTFAKFVAKQVGIKKLPRIRVTSDPDWSSRNGTFGHYDQNNQTLTISLANRHIMDVLRTMAHELVHAHQDSEHKLPAQAGKTGSPYENEANAVAGRIMRRWAKQHGDMFDQPAMEDYDPNATPPGPETKPTMPAGTVRVDVSDVYDWYKLGQHVSNLKGLGKHDFGKGPPSAIMSFGSEEQEHKYINDLEKTGLTTTDIDPVDPNQPKGMRRQKTDPTYNVDEDWKSALGTAAAAACIAGTPGCATTNTDSSPTADVLRGVQTVGRTAQAVKDMGVGGAKEELINQLRDKLRGIREASGYIPTKKQARDPRFSMALTTDIKPGQLGKEANKLNLDTDSQGHPALLMKKLNNLLESVKTGQDPELLDEDELFELNMSPTNLKKMAAETGAMAGIEFEMYVPNAADDEEDEYGSEPDYEMDESFPTGRGYQSEVIDFFRGGDGGSPRSTIQRALDVLSEDYWSWKEENFEGWFNDNDSLLDDYLREELPQDQDESDEEYIERLGSNDRESERARDRAMERVREDYDQEDQWEDFLRDNDIGTMADFGSAYNVDWPYYNYSESNRGNIDINDVASDFQSAIGRRVTTGGYHSGAGSQTDNYRVETDSSLSDPNDPEDGGLEFISPPLPIDEMLSDFDKVVKWAARNDCYTNSTTGLHMNVSVPNFSNDKLDYVKLAIFLGDEYVLDQFGRAGNSYCQSAMENIRKIARTQPDKVKTMLQQMQGNLSAMASKIVHTGTTNKYTSINTQDGYIEFRSPGGDWLGEYAADPGKIQNTLLRFTVALDVAMKPELYRKEYMKKLYKTLSLGESNDTIQFFARYAAGDLPQSALKSFVKQAQLQRKAKKLLPGAIKGEQLIQWKATSGAATTTVVARNEEEARKKAAVNIGIPFTDRAIDTMDIQPLDLYTGPVNQYNIIRDDTGFDLGSVEGVDERDAITTFRVQKPQWSNTDITARLATSTQSAATYPAATSNTPGPWTIMNQSTRRMIQSLDEPFIQASQVAAEIAMGNNIRRADIRIINTENGQVYDIDGRPSSYNTGQSNTSGGGFDRAPHTSIYQLVDNRDGRILLGGRHARGETRTFAYAVEMAGLAIRSYGVPSGDIRIVDMATNRSYNIDGSPADASSAQQPQVQGFRVSYTVTYAGEVRNNTVTIRARNADAAMDVMRTNLERAGYTVDRIEADPVEGSRLPDPPEAVDIGSMPSRDQEFTGIWEVVSRNTDEVVHNFSGIGNAVADATIYANRWARTTGFDDPIYVRPLMRARDNVPRQQGEVQARGTESLPSGNTRWLVLDPNNREVYSFVHRSNQGEANVYAANWLRDQGLLGTTEFMVVPAR